MIPQAEYILDLQKQLTLLSGEPRKDMNGGLSEEETITSMTPVEKVSFMLLGVEPKKWSSSLSSIELKK